MLLLQILYFSKQNYLLETNGTAELKLKIDRKNGYDAPLVMEIDDLPFPTYGDKNTYTLSAKNGDKPILLNDTTHCQLPILAKSTSCHR